MNKTMKCYIHTISPVHIGCDEVYEPMGFIIDQGRKKLISFDPLDFFKGLDDKGQQEFASICQKGTPESIIEIYNFMHGKNVEGHAVNVCPGLIMHYKKNLSLSGKDKKYIQKEINNFSILRTAFNPNTNKPYIPGSSIKGAIRTAWMNHLAKNKHISTPRGKNAAKDLERNLLDGGNFETDPFRMLKVSDFTPVPGVKTQIVYAVNEKKTSSKYKAGGPYQILEVIEPGSIFEGSITITTPQKGSGIRNPLDMDTLLKALDKFYAKEKDKEDAQLKNIGVVYNPDIPEDKVLLRLGRHSGAEAVTIEGYRNIKIMKKQGEKPDYPNHTTTFWLASDNQNRYTMNELKPFGWVAIVEGTAPLQEYKDEKKEETPHEKIPEPSDTEKLLRELEHIKGTDMGRIGTVIQKMDKLENDKDKASIALAIKRKMEKKQYKKLITKRPYLEELIKQSK